MDAGSLISGDAHFLRLQAQLGDSVRSSLEQLIGSAEHHRALVQRIVERIATVLIDHVDAEMATKLQPLRRTRVVHPAELWTEEWATPFMCSWQASGSENSLLCPPVFMWTDAHLRHVSAHGELGRVAPSRAAVQLMEFMYCYLVPCHEVIHVAQHLVGQVDHDPTSWSAEHDASSLNAPLLARVLAADRRAASGGLLPAEVAPWFQPALLLQVVNKGLRAHAIVQRLPQSEAVHDAFRAWADSFGLASPRPALEAHVLPACEQPDAVALQVESCFKWMVTGQTLGSAGLRCTTPKFELSEAHFRSERPLATRTDTLARMRPPTPSSLTPPTLPLHKPCPAVAGGCSPSPFTRSGRATCTAPPTEPSASSPAPISR